MMKISILVKIVIFQNLEKIEKLLISMKISRQIIKAMNIYLTTLYFVFIFLYIWCGVGEASFYDAFGTFWRQIR